MTTRFTRFWRPARRLKLVLTLGLLLAPLAIHRLCAGEIPNVRAITACLRRQRASLSEACRAVFQQ